MSKWDWDLFYSFGIDILKKLFLSLGSLGPPGQSEVLPALLPLTPTEELEDHRSAVSSGNTGCSLLQNPPDHMDLFAQDPSQDFCLGFIAEDSMNLLTQDLVDTLERSSYPENELHSSYTTFQEGNAVTHDFLVSPSGDFLFGGGEDGLPSPLNDLMEDAALLDEIKLLDLALEEGFSPEMAARLDEAGYLLPDVAQQERGRDDIHLPSDLRGGQVQPGDSEQGSYMRHRKSLAVCQRFVFGLYFIPPLLPSQTAGTTQAQTLVSLWTSVTAKLLCVLLKPPPIPLHPPLPPQMKVLSQKMRTPRSCVMVHMR